MEKPISEKTIHGDGVQKLYRFDNGFGASVVRHYFSYGHEDSLWELAVIKFRDNETNSFSLNYDTGITDDIIGHLTEQDVEDLLERIKSL